MADKVAGAELVEDDGLPMQFKEPEDSGETVEIDAGADLTKLGLKDDEDEKLPDELKGLTKAQIVEKMKAAQVAPAVPDTAGVLAKGLSELAGALKKPEVEGDEDEAPQKPGESDADYFKRVGDEMFDTEKMARHFPEAVRRTVGPALAATNQYAMGLAKRVLKLDPESGPVFKRYETEIEKEAKKLVKQHGPDPRVYDVAFEMVQQRHAKELATEGATAKVEELVAQRVKEELEKRGIGEGATAQRPRGFQAVSGGSSVGGGGGDGAKKSVKITPEIRRTAERKGLDVEKYVKVMTNG